MMLPQRPVLLAFVSLQIGDMSMAAAALTEFVRALPLELVSDSPSTRRRLAISTREA